MKGNKKQNDGCRIGNKVMKIWDSKPTINQSLLQNDNKSQ